MLFFFFFFRRRVLCGGEKRFVCIFTQQVSMKYSCTLRRRAAPRLCIWRRRSRSGVSDCEFRLICSLMSATCFLDALPLLLICPERRLQSGSGCDVRAPLSDANQPGTPSAEKHKHQSGAKKIFRLCHNTQRGAVVLRTRSLQSQACDLSQQ